MSEETKFYEGTYLVRILSDREQTALDLSDVGALIREADTGDCVGTLEMGDTREVTPAHMVELLYRAGSEPGFFNLEDHALKLLELRKLLVRCQDAVAYYDEREGCEALVGDLERELDKQV